jgi:hypothetical protein
LGNKEVDIIFDPKFSPICCVTIRGTYEEVSAIVCLDVKIGTQGGGTDILPCSRLKESTRIEGTGELLDPRHFLNAVPIAACNLFRSRSSISSIIIRDQHEGAGGGGSGAGVVAKPEFVEPVLFPSEGLGREPREGPGEAGIKGEGERDSKGRSPNDARDKLSVLDVGGSSIASNARLGG